jgi:hypothetical protein
VSVKCPKLLLSDRFFSCIEYKHTAWLLNETCVRYIFNGIKTSDSRTRRYNFLWYTNSVFVLLALKTVIIILKKLTSEYLLWDILYSSTVIFTFLLFILLFYRPYCWSQIKSTICSFSSGTGKDACEFIRFFCGLPEFCRLLGCYTALVGFAPTFRDYVSVLRCVISHKTVEFTKRSMLLVTKTLRMVSAYGNSGHQPTSLSCVFMMCNDIA